MDFPIPINTIDMVSTTNADFFMNYYGFLSLRIVFIIANREEPAVADPEGVQLVRSYQLSAPPPPLSVRPNYFIFMGYLRKLR